MCNSFELCPTNFSRWGENFCRVFALPARPCLRAWLGLQRNIPWRWEPGLLGNIQQPWTSVRPKGSSQFHLSPMKRWHQSGPGLREFRPGRPTAGQTCSRNFPAVTTPAFSRNATETQGSCPQQSGEALKLSQAWLEALLPSHRWIRWEIATSGYNKHREGVGTVGCRLLQRFLLAEGST